MKKNRILFVCLGNICRSPMAETVMRKIGGADPEIIIDSAGTYGGHSGEPADARMRRAAARRGYNITHRSRQVLSKDFDDFDVLVAMDDRNFDDLQRLAPTPEDAMKVVRMTDYLTKIQADHVPDPYYGGAQGFDLVIDLLEDACQGLLHEIKHTP